MLHVVASERIEPLVEDLAARLVAQPLDPMTPEWIAVGSDGLQRWLQLELARHLGATPGRLDGVAANITFAYPGTLRTAVLLAGTEQQEFDPWLVDQLVWSVLQTLDRHATDPQLSALTNTSTRSRYRRAKVIAERFGAYQLHRPEMIRAWCSNVDGTATDIDASGQPLPDHQRWQPHLWRLVRNDLGVPSPAERLETALDLVRTDAVELISRGRELPQRLVFFGPSLLPTGAGFLEVAEAAAVHRDVFVYVIEPSGELSTTLRTDRYSTTIGQPRSRDVAADAAIHPLLRSWGRLQRETALLLGRLPLTVVDPIPRSGASLLHTVQREIAANVAPSGSFHQAADDRSIVLHSCYGPTRQVEALRDSLASMLADETLGLTEDDIVVVSPALESFAPIIEAVFGPSATTSRTEAPDGTPLLRYRITGRSGGGVNPVVEALIAGLTAAAGRFEVDVIAEFLAMPAVRQRFGWTDDQLDRIRGWLEDSNVRWGLSTQHRGRFDLPEIVTGYTWHDALDQLLVGTAVLGDDDELGFGGVVPSDRAADEPVLIGQLATAVAALETLCEASLTARTITDWAAHVASFAEATLAAEPDSRWQTDAVARLLGRVVEVSRLQTKGASLDEHGRPSPSPITIGFTDVRQLIADTLAEQRGRSDFYRGGITVTSLSALRNIPYRVVCLLGADQAAFSSGSVESDDLIAIAPRIGDRDRRAEMRQTLLDAFLAAGDRFEAFSDGFDVRTNSEIPPAVVLAELADTIDATVAPTADRPALTVVHPRQPFDARYFDGSGTVPRSFARDALAAAAARQQRSGSSADIDWPNVRLDHPVAGTNHPTLDVSALKAVLDRPTKLFLTDGVGVRLVFTADELAPAIPVETSGLDGWRFGTDLLDVRAEGRSVDRWLDHQIKRGQLPPLTLARREVDKMSDEVEAFMEAAAQHGLSRDNPTPLNVDVTLDDGRRILGTIDCTLAAPASGTSSIIYSRGAPKHLLGAWVELLCLRAMDDSTPWRSVIITRAEKSPSKGKPEVPLTRVLRTDSLSGDDARATLTFLADLYETALRQPVPFFANASRTLFDGDDPSKNWKGFNRGLSDDVVFVYGDIDWTDLEMLRPAGHPLIDAAHGTVRGYAEAIWSRFEATVVTELATEVANG